MPARSLTRQSFGSRIEGALRRVEEVLPAREAVTNVGLFLPRMAVSAGQDIARTVGSVGIGTGRAVLKPLGSEEAVPEVIETGQSRIGQLLFGGRSVATTMRGFAKQAAENVGVSEGTSERLSQSRLAPLIAAAGVVTDISGTGGAGKKGITRMAKEAFEAKWGKGIASKVTGLLGELSTNEKLRKGSKTTRQYSVATVNPGAVQVSDFDLQNVDPRRVQFKAAMMRNGQVDPLVITPDGQLLDGHHTIAAARSLSEPIDELPAVVMTEREFLRDTAGRYAGSKATKQAAKQEQKIYFHGTPQKAAIEQGGFQLKPGSTSGYRGMFGEGIYLTNDAERAKLYGDVMEIPLPPDAKIKTIDAADILDELYTHETHYGDPALITKKLRAEGYDGVQIMGKSGAEELVIFDPAMLRKSSKKK